MTNHTLLCAVCRQNLSPDTDHVRIEAERVRIDDRNDVDEYYLHPRCAESVLGSWAEP